MKQLRFLTAAAVCLSLFSCAPWDQIASWKKCALVSVSGNTIINKTANTKERESKNTIASVKNAVKEQGGKALNHDLQPTLDACGQKLMEKLGTVSAIPLMTSDEVFSNSEFAAMESDVDSKAKTDFGKNLQKATANWDTKPSSAAGYKILNNEQRKRLFDALGVDGLLSVTVDFMYDLQGLGTLGSAKGVASVMFTAIEKSGDEISTYSTSYTGESDGKCDVKTGGFFKGEEMDPLLIEAFENAVDEFIADANKNLGKAKEAA